MTEFNYIVIFVAARDKAEAQEIAHRLLEMKLVACVNILDGVESHFWWQGKIDAGREALLILKTKRSLFEKVVPVVRAVHSYETPEIIALPLIDGSGDYLKWIDASVAQG